MKTELKLKQRLKEFEDDLKTLIKDRDETNKKFRELKLEGKVTNIDYVSGYDSQITAVKAKISILKEVLEIKD